MHGNHIHVALYYYRQSYLFHRLLGMKESIERTTLVINRRLGRINILGLCLITTRRYPCRVTDGMSKNIKNGKHNTITKTIVSPSNRMCRIPRSSTFLFNQQPSLLKFRHGETFFGKKFQLMAPSIWRIAQTERFDTFIRESTTT